MKSKSLNESFRYALNGLRHTIAKERNFKIHIVMAIFALIACIVLQLDALRFLMVVFSIFFVLVMELVNTTVENIIDLVCGNKPHPLAKIAKDTAAAAVLLASVLSVITGVVVFFSVITEKT